MSEIRRNNRATIAVVSTMRRSKSESEMLMSDSEMAEIPGVAQLIKTVFHANSQVRAMK
jgi:hypothetical protein